jgi:ATP-dependent exoDNAse (exonuclease V) alpha subunit
MVAANWGYRYTGPVQHRTADGQAMVSILRSRRDYVYKSVSCERVQFPLAVAYAITVHKSQGATLEKVTLNIADKEFQAGLTYVALSRVKSIQGLMFDTPFGLDAVRKQRGETAAARLADWIRRTAQLVPADGGEMLWAGNTAMNPVFPPDGDV